MVGTIVGMSKTEQVRLLTELTNDARAVATLLYGESLPEYVNRVLREAINKDWPEFTKKVHERGKQAPKRKPHGPTSE